MKEYRINIGEQVFDVCIESVEGNLAKVTVDGEKYEVGIEGVENEKKQEEPLKVQAAATASVSRAGGKVTSPLPGVVVEISVKEGQTVKAGEKLAVVEAMKMENEILSEYSGTVLSISASEGDSVLEGAVLMTIG